jgi:ABC-type branched-subunit amino acid transport system substrate-binding protein
MDSRSLVQRLLATSPQAVFVTGYGPAFTNVFKQIREINREVPIFTEISFATPSVINALGADSNGIVFDGTEMELSQPTLQSVIEFRSAYQSRFNAAPYQVAGFSHDAVIILAEAALRNGTSAKPSKSTIISLSPFQGVMSPIRFDAEGESRITLQLMKREGGTTILMNE